MSEKMRNLVMGVVRSIIIIMMFLIANLFLLECLSNKAFDVGFSSNDLMNYGVVMMCIAIASYETAKHYIKTNVIDVYCMIMKEKEWQERKERQENKKVEMKTEIKA